MPRIALALMASLALIACEGPTGPEGPQGPEGPPGAQGPQGEAGEDGQDAIVYTAQGTLNSSGTAVMQLPASVVDDLGMPAVACYVSSTGETWLVIDHTSTTSGWPYCAITGVESGDPHVVISAASTFAGYRYFIRATF